MISYSTTNKMLPVSQIIYFCKTLYMFRTVFPSINTSTGAQNCTYCNRNMSNWNYKDG